MKSHFKRGFSLIELIVIIAVIAAISAVIIPSVSGTQDAAKKQNAIAGAEALNLAMVQWRLNNDITDWPDQSSTSYQSDCYNAIKEYLFSAPATFDLYKADYEGANYQFGDDCKTKVTLTFKGSNDDTYQTVSY